jgi:hemoglobin-like flavoprotein
MLSQREILLVKMSWSYVIPLSEEIGVQFYEYLFKEEPSLRNMFGNSIQMQSKKLTDTLTFVVVSLMDISSIDSKIEILAQVHDKYEIKKEYYDLVGQAILYTLKVNLQQNWDDETEQAWLKLYTYIADKMICAQQNLNLSKTA